MDTDIPYLLACAGSVLAMVLFWAYYILDVRKEPRSEEWYVRLPSFSGHPICTDPVSVGEDVHCESTAQEVHAGVPA